MEVGVEQEDAHEIELDHDLDFDFGRNHLIVRVEMFSNVIFLAADAYSEGDYLTHLVNDAKIASTMIHSKLGVLRMWANRLRNH